MTERDGEGQHAKWIRWALGAAAVVVGILLIALLTPFRPLTTRIAIAETLFSGLAFVGVVVAIFLQSEELGLQRKELTETREELRRAAEAQENNARAMKKQENQQFLTARLSALTSLLTGYETAAHVSPAKLRDIEMMILRLRSRKLRQQISILSAEASFGFDAEGWSEDLEARAIVRHLEWYFREVRQIVGDARKLNDLQSAVYDIFAEMDCLAEFIDGRQSALAAKLRKMQESLVKDMKVDSEHNVAYGEDTWREEIEKLTKWIDDKTIGLQDRDDGTSGEPDVSH
jgi:hypothetical protein